MALLQAEYDGRVFVPCSPVELPVGAKVEVLLPPPPITPESEREWQRILAEINASEPAFATVDEALRYTRKRP